MYNLLMPKDVIYVSEADAATTNVAALLAKVRAGAEVVIGTGERPLAVLRSVDLLSGVFSPNRSRWPRLAGSTPHSTATSAVISKKSPTAGPDLLSPPTPFLSF
jgi:hypothetical protein